MKKLTKKQKLFLIIYPIVHAIIGFALLALTIGMGMMIQETGSGGTLPYMLCLYLFFAIFNWPVLLLLTIAGDDSFALFIIALLMGGAVYAGIFLAAYKKISKR